MPRFRLRTKIFLGFGMLIALLLGIAGYGCYGLSAVGDAIDRMDGITGNSNRLQELALQMELIRGDLADYTTDRDASALRAAGEAEDRALALLTEAADNTLSLQRRTMFNTVADKLRAFATRRAKFATALESGMTERGRLLAIGNDLRQALSHFADIAAASTTPSDGAAAMAMQMSVLSEETISLRFLANQDPPLILAFDNDVTASRANLLSPDRFRSPDVTAAAQQVAATLALYQASFDRMAAALGEAATLNADQLLPALRDMRATTRNGLERLASGYQIISARAYDTSSATLTRQLGLSAAATVVGIIIALLIARTISRPVIGMTRAMTRLATGHTGLEIPGRQKTDEIGEMARAVEVFRQQAIENSRLGAAQERERLAKERRGQAIDRHTKDFGYSVSGVMESFMTASATMREAASDVSESARQTQTRTASTVDGAMASARDLNAVAAAAEEMAASINEISGQVAHVAASVRGAVRRATETDAKVAGLSVAADRIGQVVQLINGIAGQTNLLALNATIEAARAGQAGRGFAVVAGEVKTLAAQTARATSEIHAQITAIRQATGEAVTAVQDVVAAIGEVETFAIAMAAAVEQQATATREISNSVQTVTANTASAADAMQQVLGIVEDTTASSRAALQASDDVSRTAETLSSEVTNFLSAMSRGDDAERRLYERIPGQGTIVTLKIAGARPVQVKIDDISRGGIGLWHICTEKPGTDAEITLPGGAVVSGRIARNAGGLVGLAFRQDTASLAQIDRALAHLGGPAIQLIA